MADAVVELTDVDLKTHEDIGRARLRMQSRQWHSGQVNAQFVDKAGQTNIALGVQISVAEPERLKLIQARRALALGQGDNIRQLRLMLSLNNLRRKNLPNVHLNVSADF